MDIQQHAITPEWNILNTEMIMQPILDHFPLIDTFKLQEIYGIVLQLLNIKASNIECFWLFANRNLADADVLH